MIAEQLKKAVLQAAIQGKLTEQLPEDGDARDLLKQIQKEKSQLVKAGKLKKEKPLPEITEDEIPFDIPENWLWVRLMDLFEIARGGSPRPIQNYLTTNEDGLNWIKIGDTQIGGRYINKTNQKIKPTGLKKTRLVFPGNLLLTNSMSYGRPYISNIEGCIHDGWLVLSPYGERVNKEFIYYLLSSEFVQMAFAHTVSGAVVKNLNTDKVNLTFIPLPPFAEQHRIVETLDQSLPEIDKLALDEAKLDALEKSFPKKMKDAILQYAIQGKLTDQLPEDGDAQDLLKQIQKEKSQLIKAGKLKKENHLPEITEDEIPFDIPANWLWVRLGDYTSFKIGKTPPRHESSYWGKDIPWVSIADMNDKSILDKTKEFVSSKAFKNVFHGEIISSGSLLMSFKLTIGKVSILGVDAVHNEAIVSFNTFNNNNIKDYLFRVLPVISQWGDKKDAIKGKTLNSVSIQNLLLPLPPLAEQKRIVEKLDKILPLCEALE